MASPSPAAIQPRRPAFRRNKGVVLLLMVVPLMALVVMFTYLPLFGWIYSFFKYRPGVPLFDSQFVGLKYFAMLFTDSLDMLRVMKNTVTFALLGYLCAPIPMIFAILLNEIRNVRFKKFVQITTTLPHFIGWIIVFSLSFTIFSNDGLLNDLLMGLGLIAKPTNILADAGAVYGFQTLLGLWKGLGWSSIIYLAAISGIDQEIYDAAKVDGAGRFRSALHVTVPGLMPTFIVLLLLSIGNFVGVGFDQYFIFKNALTADNIEVIDVYVYRIGMINNDYSYGVAIGMMKSLVSLALLFATNALSKRVRGTSII
jgi:putative aldouronate transport system permease protein